MVYTLYLYLLVTNGVWILRLIPEIIGPWVFLLVSVMVKTHAQSTHLAHKAETLQSLVELVDSLPDVVVRTWVDF